MIHYDIIPCMISVIIMADMTNEWFSPKVTSHSVSARGQTGSCSWLFVFRVTEPDRQISSGKQGSRLCECLKISGDWREAKTNVLFPDLSGGFWPLTSSNVAIERLPVTKSQSLSVHFFFSLKNVQWVYKWFKWCLNINKLPAPYMKACALRQGQTKPCASKGCEGFAAAVVVANLVIMKRSSLQFYSKVVARLYLMSVDIKSNSFEVHSVVGRVHEPAAPNGFTANLNSHSVISLFKCNL